MMKAGIGSSAKVTGSSSATVSAGPMPGRTPTSVPRKTPSRAQSRFSGVRATLNPSIRLLKESIETICSPDAGRAPASPRDVNDTDFEKAVAAPGSLVLHPTSV